MRVSRAIVFASIVSVFNPIAASPQNPPQATTTKKPVVDLPMLFRGPMPAIEVTVNGQGPFLFAIDTGGGGLARVDTGLVERLKLQIVGSAQAGDGSGQARTLDVVKVPSLAFGGVQFQDVSAVTRNYNTSASLPHIDGILGFNLFADYLLTLDYPAKRVRLERGELPPADGAQILLFESPRGIPVVELAVGSHKINAHIDSGNTIAGFVLPSSLVEKLTVTSTPRTVGRARTVSSDIEIKEAHLKETIHLGRFEFTDPTVVFPSISNEANIGSNILREFMLTFDQKNNRLRLERHELAKASEPPATGDSSGLREYAGHYGERTIFLEDGSLYLQRQGGPKLKLVLILKDVFAPSDIPAAQIKFVRDDKGRITELRVLNRGGEWEISKRDQQGPM